MFIEAMVLAMVVGSVKGNAKANESYYAKTAVVTEVDEADDDVYVDDSSDVWIWKGTEDYTVGDVVSIVMSDNGTPNCIYDDIMLSMRYSGFFVENGNLSYVGDDLHHHTLEID